MGTLGFISGLIFYALERKETFQNRCLLAFYNPPPCLEVILDCLWYRSEIKDYKSLLESLVSAMHQSIRSLKNISGFLPSEKLINFVCSFVCYLLFVCLFVCGIFYAEPSTQFILPVFITNSLLDPRVIPNCHYGNGTIIDLAFASSIGESGMDGQSIPPVGS